MPCHEIMFFAPYDPAFYRERAIWRELLISRGVSLLRVDKIANQKAKARAPLPPH